MVVHRLKPTSKNGPRLIAPILPWWSSIQVLTEVDVPWLQWTCHWASLGRHRQPASRLVGSLHLDIVYNVYSATRCWSQSFHASLLFDFLRHAASSRCGFFTYFYLIIDNVIAVIVNSCCHDNAECGDLVPWRSLQPGALCWGQSMAGWCCSGWLTTLSPLVFRRSLVDVRRANKVHYMRFLCRYSIVQLSDARGRMQLTQSLVRLLVQILL